MSVLFTFKVFAGLTGVYLFSDTVKRLYKCPQRNVAAFEFIKCVVYFLSVTLDIVPVYDKFKLSCDICDCVNGYTYRYKLLHVKEQSSCRTCSVDEVEMVLE